MKTKSNQFGIILMVLAFAAIALGLALVANNSSKSNKTADKSAQSASQAANSSNQAADNAKKDYQVFTSLAKAKKFDAAKVKELKVEELQAGTGDVISESDTISANYTGWNAKGKIFDTTQRTKAGKPEPVEFPLSGVIPGWTKGLAGKKVGGIYLLTIPEDMAYGQQAPSADIAGPLQFVVEIVAKK